MQLKNIGFLLLLLATCTACSSIPAPTVYTDPLPSWNSGTNKTAIVDFVSNVSDPESASFVPAAERIATFDNDGTLWSEQPMYFQMYFALDQIKAMAVDHPEWSEIEPFRSALAGDIKGIMAGGEQSVLQLVVATHTGMSADEFRRSARNWAANATHPQTGMKFTEMVYQPMLELLQYLRDNGFKTYIVSGGGIDFMRAFVEELYGIPPEQIVGTTFDATFSLENGIPTITRQPKISLVDDKEGKPIGIYRHIGKRPILAGGNSDGDLQMLQYTTIARDSNDVTPRLGLIVHHTDSEREYAYDRESYIGRLNQAMDEALQRGWLLIDMKDDWSRIYPVD